MTSRRLLFIPLIIFLAACGQAEVGVDTPTPTALVLPTATMVPATLTPPPPVVTQTPIGDQPDPTTLRGALALHLGMAPEEVQFSVEQETSEHARGNVENGYFLAAKEDGRWIIVYDGQGTPPCAPIEARAFPVSMTPECLNADGQLVTRSASSAQIRTALAAHLELPEDQVAFSIDEEADGHVRGLLPGGYFLAAREGENWVIIYDGQATPECESVAPYDFPTDMVPECLDAVGNLVTLGEDGPDEQITPVPDAELPSGDPDWRHTFSNGDGWPLYEDDHVGFTVEEGRARLTAFNPESWDGWMLTWPVIGDFYLEATFETPEDCAGLDRYGLVFRQDDPDDQFVGYLFGVSCDGRYSLRSWDGDQFDAHTSWTASPRLPDQPGESVRLGVWADGDTLRLYADGQRLTEVTDDSYESGQFGLFVAAAETPDFTVEVDEIAYWVLE